MLAKDMEITPVLSADAGGGVKVSPKWCPFKSLSVRLHFEQFALSSFNTTHTHTNPLTHTHTHANTLRMMQVWNCVSGGTCSHKSIYMPACAHKSHQCVFARVHCVHLLRCLKAYKTFILMPPMASVGTGQYLVELRWSPLNDLHGFMEQSILKGPLRHKLFYSISLQKNS